MLRDMSLSPREKDETDINSIHRWEYQSIPSGHAVGSGIESLKVPRPLVQSKPVLINVQLPELLICSCFDTNTPTVFPTVPLVLQQINYSNFFPLHFTLEFWNLQGCYGVDVKRALKRIIWVRPSGFRISAENH